MKSVLQAEDTEGERHISISTLLIFNTIFSRNLKQGVTYMQSQNTFYYILLFYTHSKQYVFQYKTWTVDCGPQTEDWV